MVDEIQKFENDIENVKPRFFDTYILSPFLCYYAVKSKNMSLPLRRMLFTSGIYVLFRNYSQYKKSFVLVKDKLT